MRVLGWVLGALGGVIVLLTLLWFGYGLYVERIVPRSPSTAPLIKTEYGEFRLGQYSGGDQIASPITQPGGQLGVPVAQAARPEDDSSRQPSDTRQREGDAAAVPAAAATMAAPTSGASRPILPPTQIKIPKIDVDYPIVAAHNENLPKFKGVGWYIGTGFPGFRGNMVLFGHLNGDYETFGRLSEVAVGDDIVVEAMTEGYLYTVTETKVVSKDAVEVMLPTSDYRATLITCTGDYLPLTRDYTHRLIVVAQLQGVQAP